MIRLAAMKPTVELVLDARANLGEGALWHAGSQSLFWVDILEGNLHIFNPATRRDREIRIGQHVGTVVARRSGGVLLALHHGIAQLDLATEKLTTLVDPESHLPSNRFNDGKCDPAGRFWAGTMPIGAMAPTGSLYCLDPDLTVKQMVTPVSCSNGIVWSHDKRTMYYIDTPLFRVDAFDYDNETGAVSNRREAFPVPQNLGYPDGSTLDAEGMLWIAHWGGSCVTRWDPRAGKLLSTVKVPTSNVTSCAFGGPKLDLLYMTSAWLALDEKARQAQPHAGSLFVADVGVTGVPAAEFAG